jgi:hypothetical protein
MRDDSAETAAKLVTPPPPYALIPHVDAYGLQSAHEVDVFRQGAEWCEMLHRVLGTPGAFNVVVRTVSLERLYNLACHHGRSFNERPLPERREGWVMVEVGCMPVSGPPLRTLSARA